MILAIDQGTTGTTCLVFDREGRIAGRAYSEFEQHFPRPGWVEHDAAEIWEVTRRVAAEAIAAAGIDGARARRDRDHQPARDRRRLGPGERRAAAPGAGLAGPAHRRALRGAARGRPRGRWSASAPASSSTPTSRAPRSSGWCATSRAPRRAVFGTIDSWLVFKLTGRHATDYTNASRTMLFDIHRLAWDEELCALLGVDPARLPEPLPSASRLRDDGRVRRRGPGRRGSPATSRRRSSARPASSRAAPRTPTGPAASSSSTPAPRRRRPGRRPATTVACGDRRSGRLRARGLDLRHRRRRAVAARRPRRDRGGGRDRGAGRLARGQRRRLLRPGPDRARLAALGPLRARHDRRPHPGQRPRPPGAGGAGGDRLPDRRRGRAPRRRPAASASRSSRRTAAPSPTPG